MRRFILLFTFLLALPIATQAATPASASDAGKYIQALGDKAVAVISNKALNKDQKQAGLEKLFSDSVDFPWVGRFVMGPFWRQATEDQKTRYVREYQKFLILHYTSRFTDYTSGTFTVTGTKPDADGESTVSTQMQATTADSEPVLVDYRVRADGKGGFKIFDVIVEGVSLITTQRSEFSSLLANNGIDYLIDQLAAKSQSTAAANAAK